jgi:hypothetical protein
MRQDERSGKCHLPSLLVEVVRMLVMADQDDIDGSKRRGRHSGPDCLGQVVMRTWLVEGRVHHDPSATDVDNRRRAAQDTERDITALRVYLVAHEPWTVASDG